MEEFVYILRPDGSVRMIERARLALLWELQDPNTIYVCDGIMPLTSVNAFTILITSPKRDMWFEFWKYGGDVGKAYFGIWKWSEIEELMRLTAHELVHIPLNHVIRVKQAFARLGGIPHTILAKLEDGANISARSSAARVDLSNLAMVSGNEEALSEHVGFHHAIQMLSTGKLV
jgi:hypothetical protein